MTVRVKASIEAAVTLRKILGRTGRSGGSAESRICKRGLLTVICSRASSYFDAAFMYAVLATSYSPVRCASWVSERYSVSSLALDGADIFSSLTSC